MYSIIDDYMLPSLRIVQVFDFVKWNYLKYIFSFNPLNFPSCYPSSNTREYLCLCICLCVCLCLCLCVCLCQINGKYLKLFLFSFNCLNLPSRCCYPPPIHVSALQPSDVILQPFCQLPKLSSPQTRSIIQQMLMQPIYIKVENDNNKLSQLLLSGV